MYYNETDYEDCLNWFDKGPVWWISF